MPPILDARRIIVLGMEASLGWLHVSMSERLVREKLRGNKVSNVPVKLNLLGSICSYLSQKAFLNIIVAKLIL
jgi:hypothetical protein